MLDLQAVYIRDVAVVRGIDFITMISVSDESTDALSGASVNGRPAKYFKSSSDKVFIAIPDGLLFENVTEVRLVRSITEADGSLFSAGEIIDPKKVRRETALLEVKGDDFSKAVEVHINNKKMDFVIISQTTLVTRIPENDKSLDSLQVVSSSKTITRESFFSFLIGENPRAVEGISKLLFQFIKVLMTTQGSDVFNPEVGGNLQSWVGEKFSMSNPQALVAKATLAIQQASSRMASGQVGLSIPDDEKLSHVLVLSANVNPLDPTGVDVSIKLVNYSQQTAIFGTVLGTMDDIAQQALAS